MFPYTCSYTHSLTHSLSQPEEAPPTKMPLDEENYLDPSGHARDGDPDCPTLIVTPTSAMLQWQDEIMTHVKKGALSILVYHQNRKHIRARDLRKMDIVLTSYNVVEYEYRCVIDGLKVPCKYCNRKFLPNKLLMHNKYFCGPNARRTKKQQKTERSRAQATKKVWIRS